MNPETQAVKEPAIQADEKPLSSWPGAFGVYKYSRDAVRFNLGTILWLSLGNLLIGILLGLLPLPTAVREILTWLAGIWLSTALLVAALASVRSKKIELRDALEQGLPFFVNYLLLNVLILLSALVSFLLFIIPFFFVFPRLVLASYYLVDKKLGPVEAFKASWTGTKGHVGKIWGVIGATIVMGLLVFVVVGIYFLIMYQLSVALLYIYLTKSGKLETKS